MFINAAERERAREICEVFASGDGKERKNGKFLIKGRVRRDILRHFSNQSEHLGNEGIVRVHVERQASLPNTNPLSVN